MLDIPNFRLENGLFWLRGSNGAGKTTLLRIIAGTERFKGDIRFQGHSLQKEPVNYRRLVNWADAEPLYPGFLSGADLLSFYRQLLKPETGQIERLCDRLGIGSWLGTRAASWSSGMTKKISLRLALLGRPTLAVLDEPLTTLDEAGARELSGLIGEYHRHYGTTFLLTSHQEAAAAGSTYRLTHRREQSGAADRRSKNFIPYWSILGRFLIAQNKWLLIGIKLFTCSMLYATLRTQAPGDYDLRLSYFVFSSRKR